MSLHKKWKIDRIEITPPDSDFGKTNENGKGNYIDNIDKTTGKKKEPKK